MTTIPADYDIESTASVLPGGGNALDLIGLCLTDNTRVPIGQVLSFPAAASVAAFFGSASKEAVIAGGGQTLNGNPAGQGYFGGYVGATATPGALLFAQYPQTAVAAWLRGGNISGLTLAQLQALSGSLTVVVDGYSHVIASISLASDNSFSAAAASIQAAFTDPTESSFTGSLGASFTATGSGTNLTTTAVTGLISVGDAVTGTGVPVNTTIVSQTSGPTGGAGVYVTSNATTASGAACTSASTVLDVTTDTDIAIAVGQTLSGAGITGSPVILAQITGTAGSVGTYRISGAPQSIASEAMTGLATAPNVTFDSVSGAFVITSGITGSPSTAAFATGTLAASLLLTSATGATLSQGAAAAVPATFMNAIIAQTTNWAPFFTSFDPDSGNGNTIKLAFAAWTNSVAPRYVYLAWDTDITPTESVPAVSSLGNQVNNVLNYSGVVPIYEPSDLNHAAFIAGAIAAINFSATNGRITFAFRTQTGLEAAVTNQTAAVNLGGAPLVSGSFGNGYNFVGAFGTANQSFVNYKRGTVSGPFKWLNSYVFQIWLTNQFQLAAEEYMTSIGSFPFDTDGYTAFESAMVGTVQEPGPIQQGLTFGMYAGGVTLSAAQVQEVNLLAGVNIATTLQTQGWYFQVLDPGPTVRASRGSPIIRFIYVDQGDVQAIDIPVVSAQ
jgi:hypothetical protein